MPRIEVRLRDTKKLHNLVSFIESVKAEIERAEISIVYSVGEDELMNFVSTAIRNKIPIYVVPDDESTAAPAQEVVPQEARPQLVSVEGAGEEHSHSGEEAEAGGSEKPEDIGISVEDIEKEEAERSRPSTRGEESEEESGGEEEEEELDIDDVSKYFQDDDEEEVGAVFSRVK